MNRVVILQHQTLNITVQLDAMDKVVGVLDEWKKQLGAKYVRLAPTLPDLAVPGGLTKVNIEELLSLKPDVVFVTNYAPADMVKQIEDAGLAVVAISLLDVPPEEAVKMNPVVKDEPAAIDAVKNGRIYLMPEYAKAWGYPMPEAMALGELWMAKELYPERFEDVDMQKEADAYYKEFYRTDYSAAQ